MLTLNIWPSLKSASTGRCSDFCFEKWMNFEPICPSSFPIGLVIILLEAARSCLIACACSTQIAVGGSAYEGEVAEGELPPQMQGAA